jgi:TRAP-type transport system small permease protein
MTEVTTSAGVLGSVLDAIEGCIKALVAAILVSFTLIILLDVVCRFGLHVPLAWPAELAIVLFQWQVFLGAPVVLRRGLHFHIDAFISLLLPSVQRLMSFLVAMIVLYAAVLLVVVGYQLAMRTAHSMYITLPMSHSVLYISMMVSGVLTAVFAVERVVLDVFGSSASRAP